MTKMTRRNDRREQLISVSSELFNKGGYHATSVQDIATACDISKASIYHYVDSKVELATLCIDALYEKVKSEIFSEVDCDSVPSKQKLYSLLNAIESYFIKNKGECLFTKLGLELCGDETKITIAIKKYFLSLCLAFERAADKRLVDTMVKQLQGEIMKGYIAHQKGKNFKGFADELINLMKINRGK